MSVVFGRSEYSDTRSLRQLPVGAHQGTCHDYLRRVERAAEQAAKEGQRAIKEITPQLLGWAADTRNLRCAWDHLATHGGAAAGENGLRYTDLGDSEIWELLQTLQQAMLNDTYRAGPDRKIRVSKGSGRGYRTLTLQNIQDRAIHRAVLQVVQPLVDPLFDDRSDGFRPNRGRCHALARALHLSSSGERLVWVVTDIKDAFDSVLQNQLLEALHAVLPGADNLNQLIKRIIENEGDKGLRQGSPISPLLLNIFLDYRLDRLWRQEQPDIPLLRTADDILLVCRSLKEARKAHTFLRQLLAAAALSLKKSRNDAIVDLRTREKAEWLGFSARQNEGDWRVRVAVDAWESLEESLALAHHKPAAPLRAAAILKGWLDQQGPCFPSEDRDQVLNRRAETAKGLAFDETPNREALMRRWQASHARWCRLYRRLSETADGGSARHVDFLAAKRRSDGAPHGAPSLPFSPNEQVTLHTDGSFDRLTHQGGWAAILTAQKPS